MTGALRCRRFTLFDSANFRHLARSNTYWIIASLCLSDWLLYDIFSTPDALFVRYVSFCFSEISLVLYALFVAVSLYCLICYSMNRMVERSCVPCFWLLGRVHDAGESPLTEGRQRGMKYPASPGRLAA